MGNVRPLKRVFVVARFPLGGNTAERARANAVSAAGAVESWMGLGYLLRDSSDYVYTCSYVFLYTNSTADEHPGRRSDATTFDLAVGGNR